MGSRRVSVDEELEKRAETLHYLQNFLTLFYGAMGTGKTLNAVAISHWMRALFGLPVVCIGTSIGLKPEYGKFTYMSSKMFVEQLLLIAKIAQEIIDNEIQDTDKFIQFCRKSRGLHLYRAILLVDEMQNYCMARSPHDPLNNAILNFIAQMRHYRCTMIAMTPSPRDVDRRVRDQVRFWCKPDNNTERGPNWYINNLKRHLHGPSDIRLNIYAPDYMDMYNSWAFTGFNVKSLEKVLAKSV